MQTFIPPGANPADYEVLDNTPVALPTRLRLPQNRTDQIRAFIRQEMSRSALEAGHETFEEADDIEPDDDDALPLTRYELMELEPPVPEPPTPLKKPVKAVGQPPADPAAMPEVTPPPSHGDGDGS